MNYKNLKINDQYITPSYVWKQIKQFIPKNKIIWEPFYCKGLSGEIFKNLDFNIIHEDEDFFKNNKGDIIVSNPPYSKKRKILERLKELDKPFILLMPSATINYKYFLKMYKNQIQIIIPDKRIHFLKYENDKLIKTNNCSFDCFYFCYKMNLEKDITFI